jgi:hypothetical protein
MINIHFDIQSGIAKLAQSIVIKQGAEVPVQMIFSATPGDVSSIKLALGDDSDAPSVLAYIDSFTQENDTTWTATLDASDSRLGNFMTGKGPASVNLELTVTIDGVRQVAPNLSLTVQPPIVIGPATTEGGPHFYTETEVDTLLAAKAALTVAGKYRIKGDGTFQLWNATQSKWHTVTIAGAAGAEVFQIGAGES